MFNFYKEDINTVKFGDNPGNGNFMFAPRSWFNVLQEAPDTGTVAGETKIITATHTFTAGKGFVDITLYRDGSEGEGDFKGDPGFNVPEYTYKGLIVGDHAEVTELVEEIANQGLIVLIKDPKCASTRHIQLGCKCDPAIMTAGKFTTGQRLGSGKKGYMISFTSPCKFDYTGTVTMKP